MLDQALDYMKDSGGADFGRNLMTNVQTNPMPVALVGIGLAWLMMSSPPRPEDRTRNRYGSRYTASGDLLDEYDPDYYADDDGPGLLERANAAAASLSQSAGETRDAFEERIVAAKATALGVSRNAGETASAFAGRVNDALRSAAERGRHAASRMAHGVGSAAHGVRDAAGRVAHGMGSAAHGMRDAAGRMAQGVGSAADGVRDAAGRVGHGVGSAAYGARDMGGRTLGFLQEQPLILGALGVSLGALLAAILPPTRTEEELLGGVRERLRDQAESLGSAAMHSGTRIASEVLGAANEAAEREGLTTGQVQTAAQAAHATVADAAHKVRSVVEEAASAGREALQRELGGANGDRPDTGGTDTGTGSGSSRTGSVSPGTGSGSGGAAPGNDAATRDWTATGASGDDRLRSAASLEAERKRLAGGTGRGGPTVTGIPAGGSSSGTAGYGDRAPG
jgi:hypothetical protein